MRHKHSPESSTEGERGAGPLWSRTTKNPDKSTGPLARPLAHSFILLTPSLAPPCSLCLRTMLRSLIHLLANLLPSSWESGCWDIKLFWTIEPESERGAGHVRRQRKLRRKGRRKGRKAFSKEHLLDIETWLRLTFLKMSALFLDAFSHLYERSCTSVGPPARPPVCPLLLTFKQRIRPFLRVNIHRLLP